MAISYGNKIQFTTSTSGTGPINVGSATTGFQLPSAATGIATGQTVGYSIVDGNNWEVGTGVLTSGSPWTLSRVSVEDSSSGGSTKISLSGSATVSIVQTAAGIVQPYRMLAATQGTVNTSGVTSSEDNLLVYTMPANMFNTNGYIVRYKGMGRSSTNTSMKMYFGSNAFFSRTLTINEFMFEADIVRTGPNSQTGVAIWTDVAGTFKAQSTTTLAETDTSPIVLKITGSTTATTVMPLYYITFELIRP